MQFRLPTAEDTKVSILYDKDKPPIEMDLLDLDDMHVDAVSLATKMNKSVYNSFSAIFQDAHGFSLNKTQIYLLLKYKETQLENLKKSCLASLSSVNSTESLQESTLD